MTTASRPSVQPKAWAEDAAGSPDIVVPDAAFIAAGWPNVTTPPSRGRFNWVLNYCFNPVRDLTRRAISEYDATETYIAGDRVQYASNTYVAKAGSTNVTPGTDSTKWERWGFTQTVIDLLAPKASPTFTGTPAAPTAAPGTSTTQLATTAFVQAALPAGTDLSPYLKKDGSVSMTGSTGLIGVGTSGTNTKFKLASGVDIGTLFALVSHNHDGVYDAYGAASSGDAAVQNWVNTYFATMAWVSANFATGSWVDANYAKRDTYLGVGSARTEGDCGGFANANVFEVFDTGDGKHQLRALTVNCHDCNCSTCDTCIDC